MSVVEYRSGRYEPRHDRKRGWSDEQLELLKTHWGKMPRVRLSALIGKGGHCCFLKAKEIGLPIKKQPAWSDDLTEAIKKLRDEGVSARDIGIRFGMTRNAILGRMHRIGHVAPRAVLNETQRQAAAVARAQRHRAKKAKSRPKVTFLPEPLARERILAVPESEWVPFLETTHGQCRAIMADDKRCCARKVHYRSYCEGHAAIYYHKTARQSS
jgi:GcrA cell cycle regulator